MLNPREENKSKLLQVFEQFQLSKEEQKITEDFFFKGADAQVLEQLLFRDLSEVSDSTAKEFEELFQRQKKQRKKEEEKRLFEFLFALSKASCYRLVPKELVNGERNIGIDAAKKAAIYALQTGTNPYFNGRYQLKLLLQIAEQNPEILKSAFYCDKTPAANGRILLLALYFLKKYGGRVKAKGSKVCIEADDIPLLRQYEQIVTINFDIENTEAAISETSSNLFLKTFGQKQHLLRLTGGLAYLNYPLSDILKGVVRKQLLYNMVETLNVLQDVSSGLSMDICFQGGTYDKEFGIDTEVYIYWAARNGLTEVLEAQFQNSREHYFNVLARVESEYVQAQLDNDHRSWRVVQNAMEAQEAEKSIFEVLKKHDFTLYKNVLDKRKHTGGKQEIDQIIAAVVPDFEYAEVVAAYLRGQAEVSLLYPCLERLREQEAEGRWMGNLLKEFKEKYQREDFPRRCRTLMFLWYSSYSCFFLIDEITEKVGEKQKIQPRMVEKLLEDLKEEGVALFYQLAGTVYLYENLYDKEYQKDFLSGVVEGFSKYLEERREEMLQVFAKSESFGRFLGLRVLRQKVQKNKAEILGYSQDNAKIVKQELLDILYQNKSWEKEIKGLLASKKASEREIAVRVLSVWQQEGNDYSKLFQEAAAKEKNGKVRELLGNAIVADTAEQKLCDIISRDQLVKELHKGNRKRSLSWAYKVPFSAVHKADSILKSGERNCNADINSLFAGSQYKKNLEKEKSTDCTVAEEEYLQAILLCYAFSENTAKNFIISRNAEFLAEELDAKELAVYMDELFEKWILDGADLRKRWVLYAAAIHGGSAIIEKMVRCIKEWPKCSRGAAACEAVQALSFSPLSQALCAVGEIARKFRYRQVKAAAEKAMEFAAKRFKVTKEELEDKIVPDFGFGERMERRFDYGERSFFVTITPELEMEVFEAVKVPRSAKEIQKSKENTESIENNQNNTKQNSVLCAKNKKTEKENKIQASEKSTSVSDTEDFVHGKKLKDFPAPGKRDDGKKAAAAYQEFKQIKRQRKIVAEYQKERMQQALISAREWNAAAWEQLFIKHPIMRQFAVGLIWGTYQEGVLKQSFRYVGDGSFHKADDEAFEIPAGAKIRLVHPIELTEGKIRAWRQLLQDYGIVQPVRQLEKEIYKVTESEAEQIELARFCDWITDGLSFEHKLLKDGWYRGSVEDAGIFYTWHHENPELGIGVELDFSGSYIDITKQEDITIYCARFYKIQKNIQEQSQDSKINQDSVCFLQDVPPRYFSEIVEQLVEAVRKQNITAD